MAESSSQRDGGRGGGQRGGRGGRGGGGGSKKFGKETSLPDTSSGSQGAKLLGRDDYTCDDKSLFEPGYAATLDRTINKKETDRFKPKIGGISIIPPSSKDTVKSAKNPLRPGYGVKGDALNLWTNYFNIALSEKTKLYRYSAVIEKVPPPKPPASPNIASGRKRRQFLKTVFEEVEEFMALGNGIATDYAEKETIIITSKKLDLGSETSKSFIKKYHDAEESQNHAEGRITGDTYKMTVSQPVQVPCSDLMKYINSKPTAPRDYTEAISQSIQALNTIMARYPNADKDTYQSGHNKYFKCIGPIDEEVFQKYNLSGGIMAIRGYYSSVRTSTNRVLLNLNAQCSAFYPAIKLPLLIEIIGKNNPQKLEEFLARLRVRTEYMQDEQKNVLMRVRTIHGLGRRRYPDLDKEGKQRRNGGGNVKWVEHASVDYGNAKQIKFPCEEYPPTISVNDYFFQKYGKTLKSPDAYVLNCGNKDRPVWIPAEVCTVVPGQPYRWKLNENQTSNMLEIAARPPTENARRIVAQDGGLGLMGILSPKGVAGEWKQAPDVFGITVDPNMIVVPGRILPIPTLTYLDNDESPTVVRPTYGSWNMKNISDNTMRQFFVRGESKAWTVLRIGEATSISDESLKTNCEVIEKALREAGLKNTKPKELPGPVIPGPIPTKITETGAFDNSIKDIFGKAEMKGIQLFLVILPSKDTSLYARVKFWGDFKFGIHTICITSAKFKKGNPDISAGLALKFNVKCGGVNQAPSNTGLELPNFFNDGGTMLVGIDVTHPAPGSMEGVPSIAGVVASIDSNFCQFPGSLRCQESKKEIVTNLQEMMRERLNVYISKNKNRRPLRIIVYRDGVSEGQYGEILDTELKGIKDACRELYKPEDMPRIAIIIVGKRHHTRFYPATKGKVDTAKPAHYVVIYNEMPSLTADQIEHFTHLLCYLYCRATKAVSICPPAYYADRICNRGRCFLNEYLARDCPKDQKFDFNKAPWTRGVHKNLEDSTFYI